MKLPVDCDEAVRRIGARHGPEIEALWREDLAQRRARVAAIKLSRVPPLALGRAVRALRQKRGLTQERLGELAGHSRTHITKLEGGVVPLANGTFARIPTQARDNVPTQARDNVLQVLGADAAEVEAEVLLGKERLDGALRHRR
jgi:hypothetical protein